MGEGVAVRGRRAEMREGGWSLHRPAAAITAGHGSKGWGCTPVQGCRMAQDEAKHLALCELQCMGV